MKMFEIKLNRINIKSDILGLKFSKIKTGENITYNIGPIYNLHLRQNSI